MYEIVVESRELIATVSDRQDPLWLDFFTCANDNITQQMIVMERGTYQRVPGGDSVGGNVREFEMIAYPLSSIGRVEIKIVDGAE